MGRPKIFYGPLTAEKLRTYLDYDPDTGWLHWKVIRKKVGSKYTEVGERAGSKGTEGYWVIGLEKKVYPAHRLAWLWMTGEWPEREIDHVNLVRDDNRWSNLRAATDKENCANRPVRGDSILGIKGVSPRFKSGKWRYRARIVKGEQRIHLGYFDTPEDAHAAYTKAHKELYGDFARIA